ncbi:monocarboxylate transporter 5-like [Haemaphysalis longicornis]
MPFVVKKTPAIFTISSERHERKPKATDESHVSQVRHSMDKHWGIAAAAAFASFFNMATQINSGFFFVAIMKTFGVDHKDAAWPGSVFTIMTFSGSFFILFLQRVLTVSQITLLGSVLLWLPVIGAAFAPNVTWLTLAFGALHGAGAGVVMVSLMVVLGLHFDKYLAVASGIRDAGTTLCGLAFPSLLLFLQDVYRLRGTLLIYSALLMHVSAAALFLWTTARLDMRRDSVKSSAPCLTRTNAHYLNKHTESCRELATRNFAPAGFVENKEDTQQATFVNQRVSVFTVPSFYVVVLGAAVELYGYTTFLYTIADYAIDKGASTENAEIAITYATIVELVGYVLVPLIADLNYVSRPTLATTCFMLLAISYALVPHTTWPLSYEAVDSVLITFIAALSALRCSIMTELFGTDQVPTCMAATGIILIPAQLSSPTIIGFFRDHMGSYDNMYRLLAALHLFMVLLYAHLALHERQRKKDASQERKDSCVEVTKL